MAPDPSMWSWWIWFLHVVGALYLVGFVWFFLLFAKREREAREGGQEALERFNRSVAGFPNAFYAKMLGKRPLEPDESEA